MRRSGHLLFGMLFGLSACTRFSWPENPAAEEKKAGTTVVIYNATGVNPADGSTAIPVGTTVVVNFSKTVNTGTVVVNGTSGICTGNVQLSSDGFANCVGVTVGWDGTQMQMTLTPVAALSYSTLYRLQILTSVQSTLGESLPAVYSTAGFTTQSPPAPAVTGITPADSSTGLALGVIPTVTFSVAINPGTVAYGGAGSCTGSVHLSADNFTTCLGIASISYAGGNTQLGVTPSQPLPPKTLIRVRFTTAVQSSLGVPLASTYTSGGFTTTGDVWVTKAAMLTSSRGAGAIIAVNNQIYAIGGNAVGTNEMYDPATNTWTAKVSLGTERSEFGIATYNNKIYVIGGCGVGGCGGGGTNTVYEYDTVGNTWTNCGGTCNPMATARYALGATECAGFIYAAGGYNGAFYNSVERYNPSTNTWLTRAPMANQREGATLASVAGKVYALAGRWTPDFVTWNYPPNVEEYDPIGNTWTTFAPTANLGDKPTSSGVIAGKIFVTSASDTNFREYDPVGNTHTLRAAKAAGLGSYGGAVANGKFYAINMTTGQVGEYTPP